MRVIKFESERARQLVEAFTELYCQPDVIKFVQDGAGNWVMGMENLSNPRFSNPNDEQLQAFLLANQVVENIHNLNDVITLFGVEIDYIPIVIIDSEL